MLVGYEAGAELTCADLHDLAETQGWLGRATVLADDDLSLYLDLFDSGAGVPQVIVLDRWMRVRAHRQGWDPVADPPYYEDLIETLLAE